MKFIKIVSMIAVMFGMFGVAEASVSAAVGNEVHVGCTAPGPSGAVVYSLDNSVIASGVLNTITLPDGVAAGASCTAAINALNATACASSHTWVVSAPFNVTISGSGYSLQQFVFTCQ